MGGPALDADQPVGPRAAHKNVVAGPCDEGVIPSASLGVRGDGGVVDEHVAAGSARASAERIQLMKGMGGSLKKVPRAPTDCGQASPGILAATVTGSEPVAMLQLQQLRQEAAV